MSSRETVCTHRLALLTEKVKAAGFQRLSRFGRQMDRRHELFENLADDVLQAYHFLLAPPPRPVSPHEQWKITQQAVRTRY